MASARVGHSCRGRAEEGFSAVAASCQCEGAADWVAHTLAATPPSGALHTYRTPSPQFSPACRYLLPVPLLSQHLMGKRSACVSRDTRLVPALPVSLPLALLLRDLSIHVSPATTAYFAFPSLPSAPCTQTGAVLWDVVVLPFLLWLSGSSTRSLASKHESAPSLLSSASSWPLERRATSPAARPAMRVPIHMLLLLLLSVFGVRTFSNPLPNWCENVAILECVFLSSFPQRADAVAAAPSSCRLPALHEVLDFLVIDTCTVSWLYRSCLATCRCSSLDARLRPSQCTPSCVRILFVVQGWLVFVCIACLNDSLCFEQPFFRLHGPFLVGVLGVT